MKCTYCGAPATPGVTICEYCNQPLDFGPGGPHVGTPGAGPAPKVAPPGASAAASGPYGGPSRALAPDGCWYPVAASQVPGNQYLVRYNDGRTATLPAEEVHAPCDPNRLRPGVRIFGEYEGRYYPGTVTQVIDGGWNIIFDDGVNASMSADRLCVMTVARHPVPPGTQVLAQSNKDGGWYSGRVFSGPDQNGRQQVRLDVGGVEYCTRDQLNGPAGPELMQVGKRVMGIGPDGLWYPGTVTQVAQGQCCIKFDDNEVAWVLIHEVRFIC